MSFCFTLCHHLICTHVTSRSASRIQPLSEALNDLYTEFNSLKAHLGDLTEKFGAIETFIDEVKAARASSPRPAPGPTRRKFIKKKPTSA